MSEDQKDRKAPSPNSAAWDRRRQEGGVRDTSGAGRNRRGRRNPAATRTFLRPRIATWSPLPTWRLPNRLSERGLSSRGNRALPYHRGAGADEGRRRATGAARGRAMATAYGGCRTYPSIPPKCRRSRQAICSAIIRSAMWPWWAATAYCTSRSSPTGKATMLGSASSRRTPLTIEAKRTPWSSSGNGPPPGSRTRRWFSMRRRCRWRVVSSASR